MKISEQRHRPPAQTDLTEADVDIILARAFGRKPSADLVGLAEVQRDAARRSASEQPLTEADVDRTIASAFGRRVQS